MKIKWWPILGFVCIAIHFSNVANGEQLKKLAQTSMKWLSIPVGAKATAMGNTFYCMSGNAEDIFWNPSGLGFIEQFQVHLSHLPWIANITQEAAVVAVPLGKYGVVAGSFRIIDFGSQQGTRLASNDQGWEYTGDFSPSSYQVGFGFSQRISDRFSYGLHISYAKESLGTVHYLPVLSESLDPKTQETTLNIMNLDFGVQYYTGFKDLRIGMTLRNFSEDKGYGNIGNPIPVDLHMGIAMDLFSLFFKESSVHRMTLACDLSHPRDYSERLHFGIEYIFQNLLALRTGYKTNYDEEDITFGAGIIPNIGIGSVKFGLDYAYIPFGIFGSIQVFSFNLSF